MTMRDPNRNQSRNRREEAERASQAEASPEQAPFVGETDQTLFDETLVQEARERAGEAAETESPLERQEQESNRLLRRKPPESLGKMKQSLRDARKPKMRTVQSYMCDSCDVIIGKPEDGYVVHGNIYVADPATRGGLIGNNFPETLPGEQIDPQAVRETVYCTRCMLRALGLRSSPKLTTRGGFGGHREEEEEYPDDGADGPPQGDDPARRANWDGPPQGGSSRGISMSTRSTTVRGVSGPTRR